MDYDVEAVIRDIDEAKMMERAPAWTSITKHLLREGKVSHAAVLGKAMALCTEELGECNWPNVPEKYWEMAVKEMLG